MLCPDCSIELPLIELAHHMVTHTKRDGPNRKHKFHCIWPRCTKKVFGHKNNLIEHYCTHTNAQPFMCTMCSCRSNSQSSIYRHYKRKHGRKPTKEDVKVLSDSSVDVAMQLVCTPQVEVRSTRSRRQARRHAPYSSRRKEEPFAEKPDTAHPSENGFLPTSYTSGGEFFIPAVVSSSVAGGSADCGYGAGVDSQFASSFYDPSQYNVGDWASNDLISPDASLYPTITTAIDNSAAWSPADPYSESHGASLFGSPLSEPPFIDPSLLAPPFVPQRSVSPADSILSAASLDTADAVGNLPALHWESGYSFAEDLYSFSLGAYPPYTF